MRPFWLASFIWHNRFTVHPCCSAYWYFVPSYDPIRSHCVDKLRVCPFLIHVDGQADCSIFLAFINNVAETSVCKVLCGEGMFKSLGRGAEPYAAFHFWETAILFSTTAPHFTFSSHIWRLQFLYIFHQHSFNHLLYYNHPNGCEVVSQCGFDLCLPVTDDVNALFIYLLNIYIFFFGEVPILILYSFNKWIKKYLQVKVLYIFQVPRSFLGMWFAIIFVSCLSFFFLIYIICYLLTNLGIRNLPS